MRVKTVRFKAPYRDARNGYETSELMKGLMYTYGCYFKRVEIPALNYVYWQAIYDT